MYSDQKHVLIIEDNADLNRLYTKHIKRHGFIVDNAYSVKDANQYLTYNTTDIIVLDLNLGDGTGQDVLNKIISRPDLCHVKIVVVSGTVYDKRQNLSLSRVDYVLLKPISPRELSSLIKML